jgi:hypothetical protein
MPQMLLKPWTFFLWITAGLSNIVETKRVQFHNFLNYRLLKKECDLHYVNPAPNKKLREQVFLIAT